MFNIKDGLSLKKTFTYNNSSVLQGHLSFVIGKTMCMSRLEEDKEDVKLSTSMN